MGDGKEIKSGSLATIHFDVKVRRFDRPLVRTARTVRREQDGIRPIAVLVREVAIGVLEALKRKTVNGIGAEVRIDPELGELYVVKVSRTGRRRRLDLKRTT